MQMLDEIRKKYDLSILMTTHDFSMLENMPTALCPAERVL